MFNKKYWGQNFATQHLNDISKYIVYTPPPLPPKMVILVVFKWKQPLNSNKCFDMPNLSLLLTFFTAVCHIKNRHSHIMPQSHNARPTKRHNHITTQHNKVKHSPPIFLVFVAWVMNYFMVLFCYVIVSFCVFVIMWFCRYVVVSATYQFFSFRVSHFMWKCCKYIF